MASGPTMMEIRSLIASGLYDHETDIFRVYLHVLVDTHGSLFKIH